MTIHRSVRAGLALAMLLSFLSAAWADRDRRDEPRRDRPPQVQKRSEVHNNRWHDDRWHHNRYYPPRGDAVKILPRDHRVVPYRGTRYYFHGGVWYRPSGTRFVVVVPPVGLIVPFLPPFYTTLWVGGLPYYYAAGVYYVWQPEQRAYVVTDPPPESEVTEQPAAPDELFVYPKQGQSEQQQATDRYQCHRWSADQTGFDPTQPGGKVPEGQYTAKRSDYQRAMKACLEARGYSVQ
jgi:hypothetical protein